MDRAENAAVKVKDSERKEEEEAVSRTELESTSDHNQQLAKLASSGRREKFHGNYCRRARARAYAGKVCGIASIN